MRKVRGLTFISLLVIIAFSPLSSLQIASATTLPLPDVFITELQTKNDTASQEFVELYNNTDTDIDFGDTANQGQRIWKLQFFSSTKVITAGFNWDPKTSGLTTISLARADGLPNIIAAHSYFLVASAPGGVAYAPGGVDPDTTYASGHMSDTGGGVQLVDVTGTSSKPVFTVHDNLGWYKPTPAIPLPVGFQLTPLAAGSLQRKVDVNESYLDDTSQLQDYVGSPSISPKESWSAPVQPEPVPDPLPVEPPETPATEPDNTVNTPETPPSNLVQTPAQPIQISELLPNPAAPDTDSNHEFIELFNPNDEDIDLTGYSLQTGTTFSHSFTIENQTVPAHGYLVFTSGLSSLTLANTGGQARLLNAAGQVVASTDAYSDAAAGEAWAFSGKAWLWTTTLTPNLANVFTLPQAEATKPTPVAKTAAKKSATKPAAKTPKTAKVAGAKVVKPNTAPVSGASSVTPPEVAQLHPTALASVAMLAIGYGAYEYKQDIANRIRKFRSNRAAR
jgi:uncharacterized membrane protein